MTVFSLFAKPPVFDTNASGAGNFITGAELVVDGGYQAMSI